MPGKSKSHGSGVKTISHLWINSSLQALVLFSTLLSQHKKNMQHIVSFVCDTHLFKPRQSNMNFNPQGYGTSLFRAVYPVSGNHSTYLMSLHILWVICECQLLKLRKCVTRKVLRAQHAHQRPGLFSHSYKCRVKTEQNLLCRWVIVLRGYRLV